MLTYSSYGGSSPNSIPCATVKFYVEGVPLQFYMDADAPVTVSWGPFVLPWTEEALEGTASTLTIYVPATGSLTYSFPSHVICFGNSLGYSGCDVPPLYTCQSGCSGTVTVSSNVTVVVTYWTPPPPQPLAAPTISAPQFMDGGQSATLSATSTLSGGAPPYTCQWLEINFSVGNVFRDFGGSFPCSPGDTPSEPTGAMAAQGGAHEYEFELQVRDSSSPAAGHIQRRHHHSLPCTRRPDRVRFGSRDRHGAVSGPDLDSCFHGGRTSLHLSVVLGGPRTGHVQPDIRRDFADL